MTPDPAPHALEPTSDRYVPIRAIHVGSHVTVHIAEDRGVDQKQVILKRLERESAETVQRLVNEYRILSDLDHPAIPRVYEFGFESASGRPFEIIEHVRGRPLANWSKAPDREFLIEVARRLLQAMDYIHRRGIVHRDIKPANVIIDFDEGTSSVVGVKLIDFDLAQRLGDEPSARGTPPFVAPELLADPPRGDARADLYSLGVTLLSIATGIDPASGDRSDVLDVSDLVSALHSEPLGPSLERLLESLVAPDAAERPDGARSALAALQESSGRNDEIGTALSRFNECRRPPFEGRKRERNALNEMVVELSKTHATSFKNARMLVAIEGAPGSGKSRLLERHIVDLQTSQVRVFAISSPLECDESTLPGTRLERFWSEFRASFGEGEVKQPTARRPTPSSDPGSNSIDSAYGFIVAVTNRVIEVARSRAVALVVDDVESLDEESRVFLTYFARRMATVAEESSIRPAIQIVMVSTTGTCPREIDDVIEELRDERLVCDVRIEPLDRVALASIARHVLFPIEVTTDAIDCFVEWTGGNPAAARSLLTRFATRQAEGEDRIDASRMATVRDAGSDDAFESAVFDGYLQLDAEARLIAELVALHVEASSADLLAAAAEMSVDAVARYVAALEVIAVLRIEARGSVFIPDGRLRAQIVRDLEPDRRRLLHRRLACAMRSRDVATPRDAAIAAWHAIESQAEPEECAAAFFAAEACEECGESRVAAKLFRSVAHRARTISPQLSWMACCRGAATHLGLREFEAADSMLEALVSASRPVPSCVRLLEVRSALGRGFFDRAISIARNAIEATSEHDELLAAELALLAASASLERQDFAGMAADLDRAYRGLKSVGLLSDLPRTETRSLAEISAPRMPPPQMIGEPQARFVRLQAELEFRQRHFTRALALGLLSLKMENHLGNLRGFGNAHHVIGSIYLSCNEYSKAETYFKKAVEILHDVGDLQGLARTLNNLGILRRRSGQPFEAIDLIRRSLRLRREIGDRRGEVQCHTNIANIYLVQRELAAATRSLDTCSKILRRLDGGRSLSTVLNTMGVIARLRDQYGRAYDLFMEARALNRQRSDLQGAVTSLSNAADVMARAGEWRRAARLSNVVLRVAQKTGMHHERGASLWILADGAEAEGDREGARQFLAEALVFFTSQGLTAERIETLVRMLGLAIRSEDWRRVQRIHQDIEESDRTILDPETTLALDVHELRIMSNDGKDVAPVKVERLIAAHRSALQRRMPRVSLLAVSALSKWFESTGNSHRALYYHSVGLESLEQTMRAIGDPTLMASYLGTLDARDFLTSSRLLVARVCPTDRSDEASFPPEVQETLDRLKRGFFDVERVIGSTGAHVRRTEEGICRILEISETLTSTAPMEQLLTQVVDGVVDFTGAERGFLILVDERASQQIRVARNVHREPIPRPETQVSRRVTDSVVRSHMPFISKNAMDEADYKASESIINLELRSIMCAPMVRGDRLIGLVYVDNRSRVGQFQEEDLDLLSIFAAHIAVAIENSRLVQDYVHSEKMRLMGTLASSVAHDFNNLLTTIRGRAQLVREISADKEQAPHLSTIEKAATDGIALVKRLQDLTRSKRQDEFVPILLRNIVEDVIDFTKTGREGDFLKTGRRIVVTNEVDPSTAVVGSPVDLREVFTNIMVNAMRAMPGGGTVSFTSAVSGDRACVIVKDNGIGMTNTVKERVFNPFFTTSDRDGSGLGMSIVYSILMRHGGTVRIESQVGIGTSVIIELPRSSESPVSDVVPVRQRSPVDRVGRKVLVVDDDDGVRALLRDLLQGAGYAVVDADSGLEAIGILDTGASFDLILTDLGMVPVSGWDLAAAAKERRSDVPVILITGWSDELAPDAARSKAVDRVLPKPFDNQELLTLIDELVA